MPSVLEDELIAYLEEFVSSNHLRMRAYFRSGGISPDEAEELTCEAAMIVLLKIRSQNLKLEP
ncbi:MAG: hypothetical protein HQL32_12260, partial [Planctomycetes bacterium]|nr:hypothetical protein [Planctomycetota bacterium]